MSDFTIYNNVKKPKDLKNVFRESVKKNNIVLQKNSKVLIIISKKEEKQKKIYN